MSSQTSETDTAVSELAPYFGEEENNFIYYKEYILPELNHNNGLIYSEWTTTTMFC